MRFGPTLIRSAARGGRQGGTKEAKPYTSFVHPPEPLSENGGKNVRGGYRSTSTLATGVDPLEPGNNLKLARVDMMSMRCCRLPAHGVDAGYASRVRHFLLSNIHHCRYHQASAFEDDQDLVCRAARQASDDTTDRVNVSPLAFELLLLSVGRAQQDLYYDN